MFTISLPAIPPFLSALLILYIGAYVIIRNHRSRMHQGLAYFCLSLFVWLSNYTVMYCSPSPEVALKWARNGFVGVAFIALANLYFNLKLLKISDKKPLLGFLIGISLFLAILSRTDLIYSGVEKYFWGYYPLAGNFYYIFIVYYVLNSRSAEFELST